MAKLMGHREPSPPTVGVPSDESLRPRSGQPDYETINVVSPVDDLDVSPMFQQCLDVDGGLQVEPFDE
jgi:hypothetical protein